MFSEINLRNHSFLHKLFYSPNKIIERKNVSFNQATLDYLQKDPDNNELVIVPAREHFKEYALIVLDRKSVV